MDSKTLEEFRKSERARAEAAGTTLEKKLDDFEEFLHCKEYVDTLRMLLGVEIREQ